MQVWNASLTVTNSSFVHNRMSVTAGAYGNMMGGGLCYEGRRLQMDNVVLASNSLGPPDRNCQEARGGGKRERYHRSYRERDHIYTHRGKVQKHAPTYKPHTQRGKVHKQHTEQTQE